MTENYNLINEVLKNSQSSVWENAVKEWKIVWCVEDCSCSEKCVCGKENIKYLYTIKNEKNGKTLFPIGSSCIQKFGREDLNIQTSLYEQEFNLYHAVGQNKFIDLKSGLFSRRLLNHLYKEGAFNTAYNDYDGTEDYEFMVKMFNKRNEPTKNQDKKIKAIILNSIKPFIIQKLIDKVDVSLTKTKNEEKQNAEITHKNNEVINQHNKGVSSTNQNTLKFEKNNVEKSNDANKTKLKNQSVDKQKTLDDYLEM